MIGYLGKYLKKSVFKSEDEPDSDTKIILWALEVRIISCARTEFDERISSENLENLIFVWSSSQSNSSLESVILKPLHFIYYLANFSHVCNLTRNSISLKKSLSTNRTLTNVEFGNFWSSPYLNSLISLMTLLLYNLQNSKAEQL